MDSIRDRMILENMGLVIFSARRFAFGRIEMEDLVSIGTIGLIKAVDNYDISKGAQFSTFATRCIRNEILMEMRKDRRRSVEMAVPDVDISASGCEELERRELVREVRLAVSELPDRERIAIEMYYGLNGKMPCRQVDISMVLGVGQSEISKILSRGRRKIRAKLDIFARQI